MDQSAGGPGRRGRGRGRGDCPTTRSAPRCTWARRPWRRTCRGCGPSWTRRTGGRRDPGARGRAAGLAAGL